MASENALIIWARGLAERAAAEPTIKAALAMAEMLDKVVVQSADDAARVTGMLDTVRKGRLSAKKSLDEILRDPKSAIVEAKAHLSPVIESLEKVESSGKSAVSRYLLQQQEDMRKEEAKARVEAAMSAEKSGLPAMESEAATPPTIVRSESGASIHLVSRLKVEMIDAIAVANFSGELLELVPNEALSAYRYYSCDDAPPEDAKSHPLGGYEWHGMRFYEDTTVAQRGSR
jgi:hypothetical protein